MEYTTEFDEASGICIVRVTGVHRRPDDSIVLQQFAREFGKDRGCFRFLFDMTQAEIIGGFMDTFDTATVPTDPDRKQTEQRIALVYSGDLSDHKFMEVVALSRGYRLRVFDQIDRAIEWLKPTEDNT